MENEDYHQEYEDLIKRLWPKGDGDKKGLEQQRRTLQAKLKDIPIVSIQIIWGTGCRLLVADDCTIQYER